MLQKKNQFKKNVLAFIQNINDFNTTTATIQNTRTSSIRDNSELNLVIDEKMYFIKRFIIASALVYSNNYKNQKMLSFAKLRKNVFQSIN